MRVRALLTGTLLAVLVAGCSGGDRESFDPLPRVERAVPKLMEPRDLAAVEDAARRIDPCALLNEARDRVGTNALDGATMTVPDSFFACTLNAGRFGTAWASVRVGEDLLVGGEGVKRTSVAGTLAYTDINVTSDCFAELPISPYQAVAVGAHAPVPRARRCEVATDLLHATARVLRANPGLSIGTPPLPWSRCELLRRALPASLRSQPSASQLDLSGCYVQKLVDGVLRSPAELTIESVVVGLGHRLSIGGRTIYRSREDGSCRYEWEDRRVAPRSTLSPGVSVTHVRCDEAERMVRRTLRTLRTDPPQHPPRPRPLTYPADDTGADDTGCAYLPFDNELSSEALSRCPSNPAVEVPGDPVDLVRHAEADPAVGCAVARAAVGRRFEEPLLPFVATPSHTPGDPGCAFADGANSVQVWIDASTDPAGTESNATIDGHPATVTRGRGRVSMAVAYDALDKPGQLTGTVVLPEGATALDAHAENLEEVMSDLVEEHL